MSITSYYIIVSYVLKKEILKLPFKTKKAANYSNELYSCTNYKQTRRLCAAAVYTNARLS